MDFILTALCGLSLSTACLYAEDSARFPPNAAHKNVTPFALAQAEQAPFGTDPMGLVRGKEAWRNAGQDPAVRDRVSIARSSWRLPFVVLVLATNRHPSRVWPRRV